MPVSKLLVANRGEIAIRILRAAAEAGLATVAVCSEDDADNLHTRHADSVRTLEGKGARAYLEADAIVEAAKASGCDAVHPGYGFLSESADLARACESAGLVFVGPSPETLERFGDKAAARALAIEAGVPVMPGSEGPTSLEGARAFRASLAPGASVLLKAVAGGGGRGMRAVAPGEDLDAAYERCRSEAELAFGRADVYVEEKLERARHVEIQVIGDGRGGVAHLGERECTLQRRHQKLVELAPSPGLAAGLRSALCDAAVKLAHATSLRGLATFEFLVAGEGDDARFAFIEANPRLQVEHTVTEMVTGVDLVRAQLEIARGGTLAEIGLAQEDVPEPRGLAVQLRLYTEKLAADGSPRPASGTITAYEMPSGPGLRVDGHGYVGFRSNPRFDALLAKLVVHVPERDLARLLTRARRALSEVRVEGLETNAGFLARLLAHSDVAADRVYTTFVDDHAPELVAEGPAPAPARHFGASEAGADAAGGAGRRGRPKVDPRDPLAVLRHGQSGEHAPASGPAVSPAPARARGAADFPVPPAGAEAVCAPLLGTVVSLDAAPGARVHAQQAVAVLEAMKMEHLVPAGRSGVILEACVEVGDTVEEGQPLFFLEPGEVEVDATEAVAEVDLEAIRPDLQEALDRHAIGLDEARPAAVARRRKTGQRTARENVADLVDPGSFTEYAPLVIAAQRRRRSLEDLIQNTPADGLVGGIGHVNGALFPDSESRCVVMSYDYTVLAGTQGQWNHLKKDRLFDLAERWQLPVVFFTEGGGGRPGDTDGLGVAGLDCMAFHLFGRLSGQAPLVGINSGRCFAGNAALLGCCDVVIATKNSNIGMGGPAMIEGGGLGVFRPEEVGPIEVQARNGVVDVAVEDEAEAVVVAKKYLSYFQGPLPEYTCADQRLLRTLIPENRLRVYDVRRVISTLADTDSVLELRAGFAPGMITALVRIEGRPIGLVANNPTHQAGAIESDGADKAARFMQLCDAFDLPILFLCDTPGIMVGPDAEETALVRHAARMFVTAGSLTVPFFTIVLRKGYGLGAQAMAGGSFKAPIFTVAWPTGEFGGMGLEGAVKLGYRKELEAVEDPAERKALFDEMVDRMYRHGKAINTAAHFEIDDVIDPAESRRLVVSALRAAGPPPPRRGKKRPFIDTW